MTRLYSYPNNAVTSDYIRGGLGVVATGFMLMTVEMLPAVTLFVAALFLLFLGFSIRTGIRHQSRIGVDDTGIYVEGPLPRRIRWEDVKHVKLSYFSTRRDRTNGWMQLTVKGVGGKVQIESTIDGFDDIAKASGQAARRNRINLNTATIENFLSLGIDINPESAVEPDGHGEQA